MALYGKSWESSYNLPTDPASRFSIAAGFLLFFAAIFFAMAAPDSMAELKGRVLGGSFLLIAAAAVAGGIYGYRSALAAGSWTRVRGVIVRSAVLSFETPPTDNYGTTAMTMHRPDIVFEYTYGGKTHQSDRVMVQRISSADPAAARETVDKYPVGREIQLYVNPEAPDQALIEFDPKQPRRILMISLSVAAGFLLSGILMLYFFGTRGW